MILTKNKGVMEPVCGDMVVGLTPAADVPLEVLRSHQSIIRSLGCGNKKKLYIHWTITA